MPQLRRKIESNILNLTESTAGSWVSIVKLAECFFGDFLCRFTVNRTLPISQYCFAIEAQINPNLHEGERGGYVYRVYAQDDSASSLAASTSVTDTILMRHSWQNNATSSSISLSCSRQRYLPPPSCTTVSRSSLEGVRSLEATYQWGSTNNQPSRSIQWCIKTEAPTTMAEQRA